MRACQFIIVALGLALVGCGRISEREAHFLRDRRAVVETVRLCYERPYGGLIRLLPKDIPDVGFPGEDHILRSARLSTGWYGDNQWEMLYQTGKTTEKPVDVAKLMDFYFSRLEADGFQSGLHGNPMGSSADTLLTGTKSWANHDRTLLVTAHVVSDRKSGEAIITIVLRETLTH